MLHAVEEEGLVAVLSPGLVHLFAGHRRDVDLRFKARREHLCRLGDLGGEHAVLDKEDVAVEAGALVPGAQVGDHPEDPDRLAAARELPLEH